MSTSVTVVPGGGRGSFSTFSSSPGMSTKFRSSSQKKVMVMAGVRVEVGAPGLDHDLAQEPDGGEVVQRVVDRGERHTDPRPDRLAVQLLGTHVPVAGPEQELGQSQTLARGPEADRLQPLDQAAIGPRVRHGS